MLSSLTCKMRIATAASHSLALTIKVMCKVFSTISGKMAECVKDLLCKCEDLNSESQNP